MYSYIRIRIHYACIYLPAFGMPIFNELILYMYYLCTIVIVRVRVHVELFVTTQVPAVMVIHVVVSKSGKL